MKIAKMISIVFLLLIVIGLFMPSNSGPASKIESSKTKASSTKNTPEVKESIWDSQAKLKAESYLRYTAFSRSGLIEQLEYEGFSKTDSTQAVDSLNVNWNDQAILKAKSYLKNMAFSKSGLIDQLEFEGFTSSQAAYAVANIE